MMLSLVEKLKDFQADLVKEETYVDVILQSLPPSYDQFIINYNMNWLEKSLHELINMLVQYEAMIEKSAPSVLEGEVSTSKAKGKDAGREKRKKDETFSTAASTASVPITPLGGGKRKRKRVRQPKIPNDVCIYCQRRAIGRGSVLSSSQIKDIRRSDVGHRLNQWLGAQGFTRKFKLGLRLHKIGIFNRTRYDVMSPRSVGVDIEKPHPLDGCRALTKPVVALEANDNAKARAFWARDLIIKSMEILRQQPSAGSDGEGNTRLDRVDPAENKVDPRNSASCAYEDCILDMARGGCAIGHGHHKPYPVQSEYVARTVDAKKESVPCQYCDSKISYAL
ncbi:hypothetical protein Sango_0642900 [Sesamum angolense]|uniref:Uncharacterized protein n=1 Tax=Sesamum angolense TaxID=2727404 RepID=A0AAE1X7X0_9LAMI|nr:hypothetical protein Sango_0642900 [Sesamum angolense]